MLFYSIRRSIGLGPYARDGRPTSQKWNEKAETTKDIDQSSNIFKYTEVYKSLVKLFASKKALELEPLLNHIQRTVTSRKVT